MAPKRAGGREPSKREKEFQEWRSKKAFFPPV
jgi:hypothetical protein